MNRRASEAAGRLNGGDWTILGETEALEPSVTAFCNIADCARGRRARVVLKEASRVAHELHDGLAQTLFLIACAAKEVAEREPEAGATIAELTQAASRQLREAFEPFEPAGSVVRGGLAGALADLRHRARGLALEVTIDDELRDANDLTAELLFRACREGVANAARHAGATRCRIRCQVVGANAVASVEDDGIGVRPDTDRGGVGLRFLHETLERAGGSLEVRSSPEGTALTASVPRLP